MELVYETSIFTHYNIFHTSQTYQFYLRDILL